MIKETGLIQSKDFKIGLYTRSDIINPNPDISPNCIDIQWFFDGALGKRFGTSTTNSVVLSQTGNFFSWIIDQNGSLTTNLQYYWKLDELSGTRFDSFGTNNLLTSGSVSSVVGLRNSAAQLDSTGFLVSSNNSLINIGTANFTVACWFYVNTFAAGNYTLLALGSLGLPDFQVFVSPGGSQITVQASSNSTVVATTAVVGQLNINSWNGVIAWRSNNSHIGISVNNAAASTASFTGAIGGPVVAGSSNFVKFGFDQQSSLKLDEIAFWNKVLTSSERTDIYGGGTGNTFSSGISTRDSWYSFDFGASAIRWYTVCQGTGIMASSNRGATFVTISTGRTQTWQYLDRSKNVLICTSDAYDTPLYWAGSAGTFAATLSANSAPSVKYSINYQGFLILLNSTLRNRGFFYADENLQLTDPYNNSFDLPSSADDEITAPFILNKFLYISTKYRIFRLNYTGGNPDWQYIQVHNFGFVPRTVKVFTLKQGQVAVGLDWSRRLRAFDGYDDQIISDNVENDNDYCEFAMQKISLSGSGLLCSNAEFDPNQQEFHLNVSIGAGSTQTTHAIVLNARTLSMYPYSNQAFNTTCVAESAGRQFLMAVDRSGFCHILNSGNLDNKTPINEIYDSPLLFNKTPSEVSKNKQITFYFGHESCGTLYYQDRFDFSRIFSPMKTLRNYLGQAELLGSESTLQLVRSVDLPSVQNIYQFRVTSSAGTAKPWKLTHFDLFNTGLGYGRGA